MDNTQLDLSSLSFSEAIAFTQTWLEKLEEDDLNDRQILADLQKILSQANGVRGFFVAYLTGESALADQPPSIFLEGFRANSLNISGILIKNLAMSTAMGITHQRNNNLEQQMGSKKVQQRSAQLLRILCNGKEQNHFEQERLALLKTIQTKTGEYNDFLQRWHYDEEQCQAMGVALASIAHN